jgi:hypothetical protein
MEPIPGFNLRAQVVGHGGSYVKHIQQETRCRVQIKGHGSGFMEHSTNAESDEPMYLHVAGPDPKEVQKAKELCEDLLGNVREQYERFKANPPPQRMESYTDGYGANANNNSYGGGGGRNYHGGRDSYGGGRDRESYSSQSRDNYGQQYSPAASTPAPPGTGHSLSDYAAQYAQYYGAGAGAAAGAGADPYAAYGGYQNYVAYYQYYAQQQAQQQGQAPPPPPGGENAAPPPPAGAGSPPPPPPGGSSYGAVPPPPGL